MSEKRPITNSRSIKTLLLFLAPLTPSGPTGVEAGAILSSSTENCYFDSFDVYYDPLCEKLLASYGSISQLNLEQFQDNCQQFPGDQQGISLKTVCTKDKFQVQTHLLSGQDQKCTSSNRVSTLDLSYNECQFKIDPFTQQESYIKLKNKRAPNHESQPDYNQIGTDEFYSSLTKTTSYFQDFEKVKEIYLQKIQNPEKIESKCQIYQLTIFQDKDCQSPLKNINPEQLQYSLNNKLFEQSSCESVENYYDQMKLGIKTFCESETMVGLAAYNEGCSQYYNQIKLDQETCTEFGFGSQVIYIKAYVGPFLMKDSITNEDYDYNQIVSPEKIIEEFGSAYYKVTGMMPYQAKSSSQSCYIDSIQLFSDTDCNQKLPNSPFDQFDQQFYQKYIDSQECMMLDGGQIGFKCQNDQISITQGELGESCESQKTFISFKQNSDCQKLPDTQFSIKMKMGIIPAQHISDNNCRIQEIQVYSDEDCKTLDSNQDLASDISKNINQLIDQESCLDAGEISFKTVCSKLDFVELMFYPDKQCQKSGLAFKYLNEKCLPVPLAKDKFMMFKIKDKAYEDSSSEPIKEPINEPKQEPPKPTMDNTQQCIIQQIEVYQDSNCTQFDEEIMSQMKEQGPQMIEMMNLDLGKCKINQEVGYQMHTCLSETSAALFTWQADLSSLYNYSYPSSYDNYEMNYGQQYPTNGEYAYDPNSYFSNSSDVYYDYKQYPGDKPYDLSKYSDMLNDYSSYSQMLYEFSSYGEMPPIDFNSYEDMLKEFSSYGGMPPIDFDNYADMLNQYSSYGGMPVIDFDSYADMLNQYSNYGGMPAIDFDSYADMLNQYSSYGGMPSIDYNGYTDMLKEYSNYAELPYEFSSYLSYDYPSNFDQYDPYGSNQNTSYSEKYTYSTSSVSIPFEASKEMCSGQNYSKEGNYTPTFFLPGKCTFIPEFGKYLKLQIGKNPNYKKSEDASIEMPKVELKPVDIFKQKDFSLEQKQFDEAPPMKKKDILMTAFSENIKSISNQFKNIQHKGVPTEQCVESLKKFKPSSPFDYTCSKPLGINEKFQGLDADVFEQIFINADTINKATTGECMKVEPKQEKEQPFWYRAECQDNGVKIVTFQQLTECLQGSDYDTAALFEEIIPWGFCFNGIIKLNYKNFQSVQQSQLMDETSGISVHQQSLNQRIMDTSDTVVIVSIVIGGVVTIVLIGVFTYMYTRNQTTGNFKFTSPNGFQSKTQYKPKQDPGQSVNISALQLNQSNVSITEGNVEMSIYDSKQKAYDEIQIDVQNGQDSIDKKEIHPEIEF